MNNLLKLSYLLVFIGSGLNLISQIYIVDSFVPNEVEEFYKISIIFSAIVSTILPIIWKPNLHLDNISLGQIQLLIHSTSAIFLIGIYLSTNFGSFLIITNTILQSISNFQSSLSGLHNQKKSIAIEFFTSISVITVFYHSSFETYIFWLVILRSFILTLSFEYSLYNTHFSALKNIKNNSLYFLKENGVNLLYNNLEKALFLRIIDFNFTIYNFIQKINSVLSSVFIGGQLVNSLIAKGNLSLTGILKVKRLITIVSIIFTILYSIGLPYIQDLKVFNNFSAFIIKNQIILIIGIVPLPASIGYAYLKRYLIFSNNLQASFKISLILSGLNFFTLIIIILLNGNMESYVWSVCLNTLLIYLIAKRIINLRLNIFDLMIGAQIVYFIITRII